MTSPLGRALVFWSPAKKRRSNGNSNAVSASLNSNCKFFFGPAFLGNPPLRSSLANLSPSPCSPFHPLVLPAIWAASLSRTWHQQLHVVLGKQVGIHECGETRSEAEPRAQLNLTRASGKVRA